MYNGENIVAANGKTNWVQSELIQGDPAQEIHNGINPVHRVQLPQYLDREPTLADNHLLPQIDFFILTNLSIET